MTHRTRSWLAVAALLLLPGVANAQATDRVNAPLDTRPWVMLAGDDSTAGDTDSPDPLTTPPKIPEKKKHHLADDDVDVRSRGYLCVGVGLGAMADGGGGTDPATALNLRLGLMVGPKIGVGFELNGAAQAKTLSGDLDYGLGSVGASAVFWIGGRAWLSFGAGYAEMFRRPKQGSPASESGGVAASVAFGYEVWTTANRKTGIEVQVRALGATYDTDADFGGVLVLVGFAGFGAD